MKFSKTGWTVIWLKPSELYHSDSRMSRAHPPACTGGIRYFQGMAFSVEISSVEEGVVIHTAERTEIGNQVIIGHLAMIHDAAIRDKTLFGMKAMICEFATIGEGSIIAEQSLVRKQTTIPPGKIVAGSPAKIVGDAGTHHRERLANGIEAYLELIGSYHHSFKQIGA